MTRWLTIGLPGGLAVWAFPVMADAALKGTCLIAVVLLAQVALRRRGAAVRHLLLVGTFGLLLALPVLTVVLPGWQVLPAWLQVPAVTEPAVTAETGVPAAGGVIDSGMPSPRDHPGVVFDGEADFNRRGTDQVIPTQPGFIAETEHVETPAFTGGADAAIEIVDEPPVPASGTLSRTSLDICVLVWIAGAALLLLRLACGAGLLWRARRRAKRITGGPLQELLDQLRGELALRRPVRLFLGGSRAMPMAWGLWPASILMPDGIEDWAPSQQRAVLLHELGHVARRDPLWQLIVELGRALYWFHPLVWLAAWRLHVERERACDDLVISRGVAAQDYARHLLDVVSRGRLRTVHPAIGVAMASTHKLEGRVRSILDERRNRRPVTRTVAVAGLLACVAIGLPLAMMRAADAKFAAEIPAESTEDVGSDVKTDPPASDPETDNLTIEPASPEEVTRRVRELIYVLRQSRVFERCDEWGAAIRELVEIGEPALAELIAELDRTERDGTLRALGFTLRALDDPRAVPALIRNIPKALRPRGSDCGVLVHDPELRAFLKQFERYENDDDHLSWGRPVNELLDALEKLTGHSEPADGENDPLRHVMLGGGPEQRSAARQAYAKRQALWEQWWIDHRDEFVTDDALRSLELPPQEGDPVAEAGVARFGPLFPTGPDARLGPVRVVQLDSNNYWDAPSHFDFDTGRMYQYLEDARPRDADLTDGGHTLVVNWPAEMGIDVRMNALVETRDLHAWQIKNDRWEGLDEEVGVAAPLELGTEVKSFLAPRRGSRFRSGETGTFLFTTREGGRGAARIDPRDPVTGRIRLQYRMWIDEQHPSEQAPHARERDTRGQAFGEVVMRTLQTPGRGKPFLLDLETGQVVSPRDPVVPADATAEFSYSDSEQFAGWCENHGIDVATRLTQVFSEGSGPGPEREISLIGLGMVERQVLPDAFDAMTVSDARELLNRYPERSKYAWMSTHADIGHQPDTFVVETRTGRIGLLRIWETAEDLSSITIHYRLGPDPQDRAGADAGGAIRGQVLDSNRRPIAAADVWFPVDLMRDDRVVHATTDAEGRFELTAPAAWWSEARFPGRTVWVWHEAHGLNMSDVWSQLHGDRTDEVIITLARPEAEAPFDVIRPDGTPAVDALVTPLHFTTPNGEYLPAPPGLRERLRKTADGQGRVTFRTVPPELLNSVQVDADGFGTQVLHLSLEGYEERDRQIVLGAAGRIEGRIETDDPALLDGLTLYFETRDPGWLDPFWSRGFWSRGDEDEIERRLNEGDHPRKTRATAAAPVGADGRFAVPAIAEGRLVMYSNRDEAGINGIRLTDVVVDVEAGRTQEIAVNVAPRVPVRGSVVNGETSEPVPAAIISIHDGEGQGERVVTDENGQLVCDVLAGRAEIVVEFIQDGADGWRQISDSRFIVEPPDDTSPVTLPDVVIGQADELSAVPPRQTGTNHGSLSIEYNVTGGPEEATFMLNRRPIQVRNGERRVIEKLFPGTYWLARRDDIRFPDFGIQCQLDRQEIQIGVGTETQTRFVRNRGAPVRGRVLGLRDLVGDFGETERRGIRVAETLACVWVKDRETAEPERFSSGPTFDVAPCLPDGRFETDLLEPGTYYLYVQAYRRRTPEERLRTGAILPSWTGAATVTVPEEGEPDFVETSLEPYKRKPAKQSDPDDEPDTTGAEDRRPESAGRVSPAEPPVSIAGEIDLDEFVAALLPNHRLRLDDQGARIVFASSESGELKIPVATQVETGQPGYWVSPAMTFLTDARPRVSDSTAAAKLIQLLHALSEGPEYVRWKIYRPREFDGGWVIEVDHDFGNAPGMIQAVPPYEILVDEDDRVTSLRQRSQSYRGSADVYAHTITTVYEREVRVNRGINYPEVLEEELKQAWARERDVPLEHNSIAHYPDAVISVIDEEAGEGFYVESNGARVFALNGDGATVRIMDVVGAVDLEHLLGAPVVRHLELQGDKLQATVGKHTVVTIDRASGEIESVISD